MQAQAKLEAIRRAEIEITVRSALRNIEQQYNVPELEMLQILLKISHGYSHLLE